MQWVSLPLTLTPFLCQRDKRYWSSLEIMVLCSRQYKADLIPSLFQTGDGMHSVCRRHCGLSFSCPLHPVAKPLCTKHLVSVTHIATFSPRHSQLTLSQWKSRLSCITIMTGSSLDYLTHLQTVLKKTQNAHNDHFTLPDPSELIVKHYFNNTLTLANNHFQKENPLLIEKWRRNKASKQVRVSGGHNKEKIKKEWGNVGLV